MARDAVQINSMIETTQVTEAGLTMLNRTAENVARATPE
ncbi:MAG: sugar ABC transporter permease, partial [Mesorhizobium sp.]